MTRSSEARLLGAVREAYPAVAADLIDPLLNFFTVARELVGGDADKVVVMLVISVRTKQHPDFAKLTREQLERGEVPILPSLGLNIRSIADSTGMPKETVRRKVAELVDEGLVVRVDHDVRYTAQGYIAVGPAREAIESLAVRYYRVVDSILAAGEQS